MAFNKSDIYTSSGSVKLYNSWTPYVSKFDTSSFYNWEQDNLPLYDLEERTYSLWEKAGFPTSGNVPGMVLTVSADAAPSALQADTNLFNNLSSCIAAIPEVVRFPVLVEVANFGELGPLELHNIKTEEGGSIEIINRAFVRSYNASTLASDIDEDPAQNETIALISSVSSTDIGNFLNQASCVGISSLVMSADNSDGFSNDPRANSKTNTAFYPKHSLRKGGLSVGIDQSFFGSQVPKQYGIIPYEGLSNSLDETMPTHDMSSTRQIDGIANERADVATGDNVGGNAYFNKLSKLSVKNCDGPIYVRNFFVDAETDRATAISVDNSEVVLENCVGARGQEAGFDFTNSKVTLSRFAAAYRNYRLTSTTAREEGVGAGFRARNSTIVVSSLPLEFGNTGVGDIGGSGQDCAIIASRNTFGFDLYNSDILGGVQRSVLTSPARGSILGAEFNTSAGIRTNNCTLSLKGLVDLYANNVGLDSIHSTVWFENLCADANVCEGIHSKESVFNYFSPGTFGAGQSDRKQLEFSGNGQHLVLENGSDFGLVTRDHMPDLYGNSKFLRSHGILSGVGFDESLPAISVKGNSTLALINANILVNASGDTDYTRACYGRAVEVQGNSEARFFGTKDGATFILGPSLQSTQLNCAGVYAANNSLVGFHGPTVIAQFGVDALAEDHSTIDIQPPRRIGQTLAATEYDLSSRANHTSVELHSTRACLVAHKNSTLNLVDLGSYVENWSRSDTSTVLADGNDYDISVDGSNISSGSLQFYPNPQDDTVVSQNSLYDVQTGLSLDAPTFNTSLAGVNRLLKATEIINTAYNNDLTGITLGGVCVRATEDSVVNTKNVHFPIGTNTSPLDGKFYDASGSECDKFMIWNLADTSRLHASYLSVSGMHPADIAYHGPSSFWASSFDGASTDEAPAYGAPALTPDTGPLSILDSFGAGSSVLFVPSGVGYNDPFNRFHAVTEGLGAAEASAIQEAGLNYSGADLYHWGSPVGTAKNQGPFRIYWSPKPSARVLQVDLSGFFEGAYPHAGNFSGIVGPAYQLFAQGYNCSAELSAVPATGETNASSVYPDLMKLNKESGTLWTSGYYYCSEMLEENPTQCVLDESAGRTFANSQHASLGLGGTPKKVTIYRSRGTSDTGSEAFEHTNPGPVGFKSASIFDLSRDN